jgi:hypothetical protein
MAGICPHMNGNKCAMEYCDYWNNWEQGCSLALESHKRVEILNVVLSKAEELLMDVKEKEALTKIIKELNVVATSNTIQ